ncbi:alpha/beta fold hydrolase [Nocardiopsis lambiniae]|uniref:Alpha/beta hydrolase n=1 Tax=Nocardiopsis lambiniae TaxID=3075539 RepID=A0ABU2MGR4_9ACTN|nr:alpha/beta hydrolase [Nocardiopsis sp. DSM 44743]MDT0331749.1 alpha/beta hydrolase [Nocardiopsis sp. DSM 44743]
MTNEESVRVGGSHGRHSGGEWDRDVPRASSALDHRAPAAERSFGDGVHEVGRLDDGRPREGTPPAGHTAPGASAGPVPAARVEARESTVGDTHRVTSEDGTVIGFGRAGRGRPLVAVHGTTADRDRWRTVLPFLESERCVHTLDRRGRGLSGDAEEYRIEREYEDVAAVVDRVAEDTGTGVDLLGHSYGALCALGAAPGVPGVRRVILYEPPVGFGGQVQDHVMTELESLLAKGRRSDAVAYFFRAVVGMPDRELELLRALPSWRARMATAHTIARELRAADAYRFEPRDVGGLDRPVLLLVGGESPEIFRKGAESIARALPDARVEVLPGQRHIAMDTAPEAFAARVNTFLGV